MYHLIRKFLISRNPQLISLIYIIKAEYEKIVIFLKLLLSNMLKCIILKSVIDKKIGGQYVENNY